MSTADTPTATDATTETTTATAIEGGTSKLRRGMREGLVTAFAVVFRASDAVASATGGRTNTVRTAIARALQRTGRALDDARLATRRARETLDRVGRDWEHVAAGGRRDPRPAESPATEASAKRE
jgi:hypothetical protein